MNRRSIFGVLAAAMAIVPSVARSAAATDDKTAHKLALHIDENDLTIMKRVLNNARHVAEHYESRDEGVAIEIVAYGPGLHMLREDTSPVKEEIRALRAKVPQVAFGACNNTRQAMEKTEGKTVPLIAEATLVPAGVVRLLELQEQGYKYVKP